jgi:hypothetical protein
MSAFVIDERIRQYYLLNTASMGKKAHVMDSLPRNQLDLILTGREIELYLRQRDGHYIARELVVGGTEMSGGQLTSGQLTSGQLTSGQLTSGQLTSSEQASGKVMVVAMDN